MATIPLKLNISDIIENQSFQSFTSGFNFKYKDINYVITLHHGQLINNIFIDNDNSYNITDNKIINTIWNELLIIKDTSINNYKTYKNYRLYTPHIDDILFIKSNNKSIKVVMKKSKFLYLNNMTFNPYNLYLECELNEIIDDMRSLSGSPVVTKDNILVGIMSKTNKDNTLVSIIPIYYLIKTLNKVNNDVIYGINLGELKDVPRTLYNKFLKVELPIETYIMLEGDEDKELKINKSLLRCENINNIFPLLNSRHLEMNNKLYIVTNCFLITIKNIVGNIIIDIIKFVDLFKSKKILCSIVKTENSVGKIGKFQRRFMIDKDEYEINLLC